MIEEFQYVQPDVFVIKAISRSLQLSASSEALAFLPVAQERLEQLNQQLAGAEQQFFARTLLRLVTLQNINLGQTIEVVEAQQRTQTLTSAENTALVAELKDEFKYSISQELGQLRSLALVIDQDLRQVRAIGLPSVEGTLRTYSMQQKSLVTRIAELQTQIEKDQETVSQITAAIELFEKRDWLSVFRNLIPTASEVEMAVQAATLGKVDQDLITAVLGKLTANIDLVSGGRRFNKLAKERTRLHAVITQAKSDQQALLQEKATIEPRLVALSGVSQLWAAALQWTQEVEKVLTSLQGFLAQNLLDAVSDIESMKVIKDRFMTLTHYLALIRQANEGR
ncbi:alpha-xenorhabdolysin family binary toxin subunit B [Pseudomonas sp. LS1212]|uniref:alpha-xenorhabdolysin family binary toxin subunit B n=1 Tax=Pseudomonas sp. LS1212 TaxID=2972478 RepID=UPI00215CEECD|nr:alpha-xenorhabdolysin family binary toxin subunit B [Pseudomonas sp. LS1212]UVJ43078.1 alpha-xenorhabdolysin family binary toxin subunit B [Pseudomonas sp. LS1212]